MHSRRQRSLVPSDSASRSPIATNQPRQHIAGSSPAGLFANQQLPVSCGRPIRRPEQWATKGAIFFARRQRDLQSNRAPKPLTRSVYFVGRSYIKKWARCHDAQRHASWKFWRLTVSKGKPKRLIPFVFGTMPIIHNDAFDLAVEVWRCKHASCHFLASVKLSHSRVEFAGRHAPPPGHDICRPVSLVCHSGWLPYLVVRDYCQHSLPKGHLSLAADIPPRG